MIRLEQRWTKRLGIAGDEQTMGALSSRSLVVEGTTMFLTYEYFLFAIPGMALSMWAQARISSAYAEGSRIPARAGVTGAEAAAMVMQAGGVTGVAIEPVAGELSDHYDPRHKVLRLSQGVYGSRSLAAVGIAAHEAGHAIQDASHYPGLVVRNLIVPMASIGSMLFWVPVMAGLVLGSDEAGLAGNHPLFADGRLSARQPAGRVQRQPPRPADPSVHRADQPR